MPATLDQLRLRLRLTRVAGAVAVLASLAWALGPATPTSPDSILSITAPEASSRPPRAPALNRAAFEYRLGPVHGSTSTDPPQGLPAPAPARPFELQLVAVLYRSTDAELHAAFYDPHADALHIVAKDDGLPGGARIVDIAPAAVHVLHDDAVLAIELEARR